MVGPESHQPNLDVCEAVRIPAWWDCAVQASNAGRRAHDAGGRLPVGRAFILARLRALRRRLPQMAGAFAQADGAPARAVLRRRRRLFCHPA